MARIDLVRDLMSPRVAMCKRETLIPQVARQMRDQDVSALVVVDENGFMEGIISRTDLVTLRAHEEYWQGLRAEHVMVSSVVCVTPDTPITDALAVLLARKIHRLVVVEDCNTRSHPVGIFSITDVVRDMAE
jgi:signal-transduction protein with cAMP-binding, CBS, and nucleotidyltransferase domain